jgi:hypothetical protein
MFEIDKQSINIFGEVRKCCYPDRFGKKVNASVAG